MSNLSADALEVQRIAKAGFADAVDTLACISLYRRSCWTPAMRTAHRIGAERAIDYLQKALLQRIFMNVERAFDPMNHEDDWNTAVAFELLARPGIADELAVIGNADNLSVGAKLWKSITKKRVRKQMRNFRNKVVVHYGKPDPRHGAPLTEEFLGFATNVISIWAHLAYGSGILGHGMLEVQLKVIEPSIKAFWTHWSRD